MPGSRTVVVGGGTAGCIVAARLASSGSSVTLLEKGMNHSQLSTWFTMPASRAYLRNSSFFPHSEFLKRGRTLPQQFCANRMISFNIGNVLGGSGTITNDLSFIRPPIEEIGELFSKIGSKGLCQHVFKHYEEDVQNSDEHTPRMAHKEEVFHAPCSSEFISSSVLEQLETLPEISVLENSQGTVYVPKKQIDPKTKTILSTYSQYLVPTKNHELFGRLLSIKCNNTVNSITFDNNNVVQSVNYTDENGSQSSISCDRVILCAGALESPKILMASGIGSPNDLSAFGAQCRIPLAEVGKNLHDQMEVNVKVPTRKPITSASMYDPFVKKLIEFEWSLFGSGWGKYSLEGPRIYGRSPYSADRSCVPDYGIFLRPYMQEQVPSRHGCTLDTRILKPLSRGQLIYDPTDKTLRVDPRYLSNENDLRTLSYAINKLRLLCSQKPLEDSLISTSFFSEESQKLPLIVNGCGNFGGTCAIGTVLSSDLRVENSKNCYVCDSSAIPSPVSAGLSSSVMLMAHLFSNYLIAHD